MRFGCCVALASFVPPSSGAGSIKAGNRFEAQTAAVPAALRSMEEAGCDFAEFGVGMVGPELPEESFNLFRSALEESPLKAECFNSFIAPHVKLTGPNRDWERIERYVGAAAQRVAAVGGEVIVFGSGGARNVPDGFPRQEAQAQLDEFLHMCADKAAENGIRIAIEPLNRRESNILNSVEEAHETAERVNRPEIAVLTDFYHLMEESEPFEAIENCGNRLIHVHVADTGRLYPGSGRYDYPRFYEALYEANYDARVSVECNWIDFTAETAPAMSFLRESFADAMARLAR